MAKVKFHLAKDVLTAARERIHHIADTHDHLAVCFSGGKDSLVTLHLTKQVLSERGQKAVNVIFRDEELIPGSVIDFVNEYRREPWVNMLYFAVPLASTKYILGRVFDYVQWDPNRRHLRPIPEHAITLPAGDPRVFDQYNTDAFIARHLPPGKVAFLTGIRASESLMRYRASVNKLNDNYINACSSPNVSLCKPIYDWEEADVFKFFYENGIRYCPLYDSQNVAGASLRVSTPLHAESAKRLNDWKRIDPDFYQQVIELFPEMLVQGRYYRELDKGAVKRRYGQDFAGVRAFILEQITEETQQEKALKRLEGIVKREEVRPGSYPPAYTLNYFMTGAYKRELTPVGGRK
jgi:predicted phosphoadenosine phosphosulfate sulfurtransferase